MPSKKKELSERYTTLAGEVLEYPTPTPAVAKYLAQVVDAAHNPEVTESAMVALVYGEANPLLKAGVIPGQGLATRDTYADPVFHVMLDLLGRKRVQVGTLDMGAAEAKYTMTVKQAAEQLSITTSAVRQAIDGKRLDAIKKSGGYFLRPASVDAYYVSGRGPKPRSTVGGRARSTVQGESRSTVGVRMGSEKGRSFRVKVAGGEVVTTGKEGGIVDGTVTEGWEKIGVITGHEGKYRFAVLEPGDGEGMTHGAFHVEGGCRVVEKENNSRRAQAAWRAFGG